jgi:cell division cycle 2-like protein
LYSAPEILLGTKVYSTAVDMWSVGCIFAELLLNEPLFQAKGEVELLAMIFKLLGPPTSNSWPNYASLPLAKTMSLPSPQPHQFRQKFQYLTAAGLDLLMSLLTYDPERRISAEEALQHPYFRYHALAYHSDKIVLTILPASESPLPKHPDLFGSFPSAAAGERYALASRVNILPRTYIKFSRKRKLFDSPSAPIRAAELLMESDPP